MTRSPFRGLRNPSGDVNQQRELLLSLKEALEQAQRVRGDDKKSFVRLEELIELGLADQYGNLLPIVITLPDNSRALTGPLNVYGYTLSNIGILNFQEVADPGLATADHAHVHLEDQAGISQLHFNDSAYSFAFMQDRYSIAKNTSGGTLSHGTAVYITGATGQRPTIAGASAASGHHALGLVIGSTVNNGFCRVLVNGSLRNFDTSSWTEGDKLYLSTTAGGLTNTAPAHPNSRQVIGVVAHSHATQGIIAVHHHDNERGSDGSSSDTFAIGSATADRAIFDVTASALTGARTFKFQDLDGTMALLESAQAFTQMQTFNAGITNGTAGPTWTQGTGTPEGVVTAPVGSMFSRTDGGAGTSFYVKESGTGNTGWVAK